MNSNLNSMNLSMRDEDERIKKIGESVGMEFDYQY